MRILHILDHSIPLHSGYTFRTLSILKAQQLLGWETFHLTSIKQGKTDSLEEDIIGWHFYRTPTKFEFLSKIPILNQLSVIESLTQRLSEVVGMVKPDILHAHSPALNAIAALRVGRRLGIPVVYEIRAFWEDAAVDHGTSREWGLRYRLTRLLETYAIKQVDAVTTICEGLCDEIISRGIPSEKITVIPNAVDIEKFSVNGAPDLVLKEQLGLKDKRLIGFVGSYYAYEGLGVLIQALPLIRTKIPELCILLVGGGPQDENLKDLVSTLNLEDKVIFVGRVPHEQVQKYYDLIEVMVYPRLPMRLTDLVTPLKPLEAMAQGRLVAASDVGGHRELIKDGETGVLFKSNDPYSLADKITELLMSPERWPVLCQAGRQFVETERNWSVSVARYRKVYGALLAEKGISI